jgi:hypothetical protein
MKPKLLLRIAAVLILFHALGHTYGHLTWKLSPELTKQEVIKQMTENKFPFMGTVRSMTEYYDGFGFIVTVALLMIAVLLWVASNVTAQSVDLARKFVLTLSLALMAFGVLEVIYFFPFAAAFSFIASVLGFYSIVLLTKQKIPVTA